MNNIVLLSLIFAFSEFLLVLAKHSKTGTSKTRKDRGSLILMWLVISTGFCGGFFLSNPISPFWLGFGSVFIIFGVIIRWIAILQLGKSFTVDVAITETARLKTDGMYSWVRHPSYFGLLMILAGFSSLMSSIYSFLVLVIPVFLAVIYRISVEEELLIGEFGNSYLEYRQNTKKIIPGIF
jgi:protein-S-isoprenylcysteine O-methyltransferase Ste14